MVDQTAAPTEQAQAVNRKLRTGTVVSDRNDKTIVVSVQRTTRHRLYRKVIRRSKRYHVHDEHNEATVGDLVRIEESRPYSRLKRYRLVQILTEREVAEVAPEEIDEELVDEVQRSAARAAAEEADDDETEGAPESDPAGDEPVAQPDPHRTEVDADDPAPETTEQVGDPSAEPVAQPDEQQPDEQQPDGEQADDGEQAR